MNQQTPVSSASVLVVCLCAEWCGVCRDYQARFKQLQSRIPQAQFLWIDVEDEADLLHPLDVEDFPTILVAVGGAPRFYGPLTPQLETLERLVRMHMQDLDAPALSDLAVAALVTRLRATKSV